MEIQGTTEFKKTQDYLEESLGFIRASCTKNGAFDANSLDEHQYALYNLALSFSELEAAKSFSKYAITSGTFEKRLATCFFAEVIQTINARLLASNQDYGIVGKIPLVTSFISDQLSANNLSGIGEEALARNFDFEATDLTESQRLIKKTFFQFAEQRVAPSSQNIHRFNTSIPEELLKEMSSLGCFGLSIPERYGGHCLDDKEDELNMILVTEELSRASLGGAGSLITRPEIMTRALLTGGSEKQKEYWLPKIASGEKLCAIAITEPDFGSDVASLELKAKSVDKGWLLSGSKTWSTFAGRANLLLTLARTDPEKSLSHRGLSLFIVEKPSFTGEEFKVEQRFGGMLSGNAIPTIGYRGMHSYQLFFDDFFVPNINLIGGKDGIGKGFYFTMQGLTAGRIQTAARACGVIKAAIEKTIHHTRHRRVFSKPLVDYQLTQVKLARMAMHFCAARTFTYSAGKLLKQDEGQMEASLVKLFSCRASEWITREAMQLHGGMGYAEESEVSRCWLDARVLSIFEGSEETLALKVIGRKLIEDA